MPNRRPPHDAAVRSCAGPQAPVQLVLPAMEILTAMRAGVGELIRRAGLELMCLLMEQEVEELVGKRSVPSKERTA